MDKIVQPQIVEYLSRKADIRRVPLSGALEISPICNMDCKMCYVKMTKEQMNKAGRKTTFDEWIDLAKQAKEMGTLFLLITGGEPFLDKDFKKLYIELYNMGFIISINSNATLIDEKQVEWLSKYKPRCVNVTLYGASNETYKELCNNPKGFDQATRGIKLLKEAGIQVKINASITQYNQHDIEKIHEFGKENDLVVQAGTYMYPPLRRDKNSIGKNDRLTPQEAAKNFIKVRKCRMNEERFKKYIEGMQNGFSSDKDDECSVLEQGEFMKCRAGVSTFWITWDGRMMACGMMNEPVEYPIKTSFEEAWKNIVKKRDEIRLPLKCANCEDKQICNACAATSYTETGLVSGVPTYMCEMTKYIKEEVDKIMNGVMEEV